MLRATIIAAAMTPLLAGPALAKDGSGAAVATFYDAIKSADSEALASVLADDAVIRLADLGFDMTGEEFVASMDEWESVAAEMTMRVKPDPEQADSAEMVVRVVCYEFPSNVSMTRETSTLVDGKIARNVQEEIAENCDGF